MLVFFYKKRKKNGTDLKDSSLKKKMVLKVKLFSLRIVVLIIQPSENKDVFDCHYVNMLLVTNSVHYFKQCGKTYTLHFAYIRTAKFVSKFKIIRLTVL